MQVADRLGTIYQDAQFAALFPRRGQPAEAPARLALVTVLQFAEGFSDRQAADAVRSRIDWKYVLGLELADPGFHHTVLSEFRGGQNATAGLGWQYIEVNGRLSWREVKDMPSPAELIASPMTRRPATARNARSSGWAIRST